MYVNLEFPFVPNFKQTMASKPTYETKTTSKQIRRVKVTKTVQKTLPDVRKVLLTTTYFFNLINSMI